MKLSWILASALSIGCADWRQPPVNYGPPINMMPASASPNAGGQLGTVPVGAMVVTSNGYVYRRGLPAANMYRSSSPMAAQLRAEGEALAQQDYAAAAASAAEEPTAPTSGGTTGSTGGGPATERRMNAMAEEQVQLHRRVSCLEHPNDRNCH